MKTLQDALTSRNSSKLSAQSDTFGKVRHQNLPSGQLLYLLAPPVLIPYRIVHNWVLRSSYHMLIVQCSFNPLLSENRHGMFIQKYGRLLEHIDLIRLRCTEFLSTIFLKISGVRISIVQNKNCHTCRVVSAAADAVHISLYS